MSIIIEVCTGCPFGDAQGHTGSCEATWQNSTWINREKYYNWRLDAWVWRAIPATRAARVTKVDTITEGSLTLSTGSKDDLATEAAWARGMKNWTEEEVAELLGR